jgi:hypothetical protein
MLRPQSMGRGPGMILIRTGQLVEHFLHSSQRKASDECTKCSRRTPGAWDCPALQAPRVRARDGGNDRRNALLHRPGGHALDDETFQKHPDDDQRQDRREGQRRHRPPAYAV